MSEPGQEGEERAGRRAGALASRAFGSPLCLRGRFSLSLTLPLTGPERARRTAGRASCELPFSRWAQQKLAAAVGRRVPQTPGLRALQPHVEPSSAWPPFQGSRARDYLGAGLLCIWARGFPSTGMRLYLSTSVRGSLLTVPHRTWVRRPKHPPAHLYANMRQHTGTEPPAEKHGFANTYTAYVAGPVRAHSGSCTGGFVKCIQQTFWIWSSPGFGLPLFYLNACVSVEGRPEIWTQ